MRFKKHSDRKRWVNGVKPGRGRRAIAYNLREYDDRGRAKDRNVRASRLFFHAMFDNRFGSVRGVSSIPA